MDLVQANGVELHTDNDVNFDIAPGWDQYKVCGDGTIPFPWQFSDAMAIQSTFPALAGLTMTTYGFRSEAAKCAALEGENTFTVPYKMDKCRLELVVEIPVPGTTPLSFEVSFYVHHATKEQSINAALKSTLVGQNIVISYESRELASMQIGLACKQTEQAIPEAAITREMQQSSGGEISWYFEVKRDALQDCQTVVWDPLFSPSRLQ
jgi:hypothetical protein